MAVARQIIGIGAAHRAKEKLVAHRAAIDEKILAERVGAAERRQSGETLDPDAVAFGQDLDRIGTEIGAQDVAEPGETAGGAGQRRRENDRRTLLAGECEGDIGRLIASRRTTSRAASASVRSSLRNFKRAGVA